VKFRSSPLAQAAIICLWAGAISGRICIAAPQMHLSTLEGWQWQLKQLVILRAQPDWVRIRNYETIFPQRKHHFKVEKILIFLLKRLEFLSECSFRVKKCCREFQYFQFYLVTLIHQQKGAVTVWVIHSFFLSSTRSSQRAGVRARGILSLATLGFTLRPSTSAMPNSFTDFLCVLSIFKIPYSNTCSALMLSAAHFTTSHV
jgi:hypothetical protein